MNACHKHKFPDVCDTEKRSGVGTGLRPDGGRGASQLTQAAKARRTCCLQLRYRFTSAKLRGALRISVLISSRALRNLRAEQSGSDLQGLEIRDALLREIHVLLDEVVLDPAGFRRLEGLDPVDGSLTNGFLRPAAPTAAA